MISLIIILSVLLGVAAFAILNMVRKLEAFEDFTDDMRQSTRAALKQMRDIDRRGAFEADDEVGDIFKQLQEIVERLEEFAGESSAETTSEKKQEVIQ